MALSKNVAAATLTKAQAAAAGVLVADNPAEVAAIVTSNTRKLFGFTRKVYPQGLPTEPLIYIYSVTEYGETIDLGPGLPRFTVNPCPLGDDYGEPCEIPAVNLLEEAKVDVTEHTFFSGQTIADAILKIGPGMNAAWDKRRWGWFQSDNNPPLKEEIAAARAQYTETCKRLLQEGNRYAAANQLNEINETHRRAATWLKQKVDWSRPTVEMVDCCGCGEPIKAGAPVHAVPYCGAVQPGKWPEAIANGMKKMSEAPADVQYQIREKYKKDRQGQEQVEE